MRLLKNLYNKSIWGPSGVSPKDERLEAMLRGILPRFDIACIIFGVLGFFGGIPALRDVFSPVYAQGWSVALAVASAACLVGVAYPERLWRLEFTAKSLLVALILLYAVALAIAGVISGDLGRGAVAVAVYALAELPLWRLGDIARDRRVNGWT